ncbi:MAG TPA: hypothetical protein VIB82_03770, partial [Caulobacteraceae bacterium]
EIIANSRKVLTGDESDTLNAPSLAQARARMAGMGMDAAALSDADLQAISAEMHRRFRDEAPTTAAQAATIILDGVREGRWRILVGADAKVIDAMVRAEPESAYEAEFFTRMAAAAGWNLPG